MNVPENSLRDTPAQGTSMIGKKRRRYFLQIDDQMIPGTPTGLWGVAVSAGRGTLFVMKKDGSLGMVWQYHD